MKTFITLLLTIATITGFSQNKANLMISQDARLAILGDDKGNEAFTTNIRIASEWQGKQLKHGYFFGRPEFEYADLQETFIRTSLNFGFTHNMFSEYFDISYSLGYGIISRKSKRGWYGNNQFGADVFLIYKLNNSFSVGLNTQAVDRNELKRRKLVLSNFIVLIYNFK